MTAPVVSSETSAMLATVQKPDRVSSILRSSVAVMRRSGMPRASVRGRRGCASGAGRGHASAPSRWWLGRGCWCCWRRLSRWVSAVSWRNISSSPVPSAGRSSRTGTPAAKATRPTCSASAWASRPSVADVDEVTPCGGEGRGRGSWGRSCAPRPGRGEQVGLGALRDDAAVADDHEVVGDHLDLVQQVRGEQHRAAPVREVPEQPAHPSDAGRVEAVGRLVEDQDPGSPISAVASPSRCRMPRE